MEATPLAPMRKSVRKDPWYVRVPLIVFTVLFVGVMIVGPLVNVFVHGFELGFGVAWAAISHPHALHALQLTLIAAGFSIAFNATFGIAAAWAVARFRFRGKAVLTSLIDLPFSVSPVIAGLIFVLLFGAHGFIGALALGPVEQRLASGTLYGALGIGLALLGHQFGASRLVPRPRWVGAAIVIAMVLLGLLQPVSEIARIEIIFALPGIVLATMFVTFPFIARELIPVLEAIGPEEEEAARTLGASGWQMFWYVTLPNIKWGLLYGILLCNARAIGEFGAVSVVSGKLAGRTDTLPIHIEKLYQAFGSVQTASAFAISSLLCCLALATLVIKALMERKVRGEQGGVTKTTD